MQRALASRLWSWLVLALAVVGLVGATPVQAQDQEDAPSLLWRGKQAIAAGLEADDREQLETGLACLARARFLLEARRSEPGVGREERARLERDLGEIDDVGRRAQAALLDLVPPRPTDAPGAPEAEPRGPAQPERTPEVRAREIKEGERLGAWVKDTLARYAATPDGLARSQLAVELARKAGVIAVPALLDLFRREEDETARQGVHEALALAGTSRVADAMAAHARRDDEPRWQRALDVIYRALERPEAQEPERPWCRAIRAFHRLEERKLSLGIVTRLDAMGPPGVAALGEILYVDDFGYHDHATGLLATKRDRRAVPPLVFKLNRFKFEAMEQMPAHKALLSMGWYAVPELVDRLDDKAAGVWISWTLRKITGETMGTDKRKWHDWWKGESVRHPELFEDPEERPGGAPAVTPTTPR